MPNLRDTVDSLFKSLTLGVKRDVLLESDDAGRLKVGTVPMSGYDTVASAAALPAPTARVMQVTGTTAITSMGVLAAGAVVTLIFASTPTFTDGGNLKLAGNLVATADDTISLVCDGTNWFEIGRAVN